MSGTVNQQQSENWEASANLWGTAAKLRVQGTIRELAAPACARTRE